MKYIITILIVCCGVSAFATNKVFNKLAEVNKCWLEQKDIDHNALPKYTILSEREWIRTHLIEVEKTLRKRSTTHLNATQKQNRLQCLNSLNQYWHEGNFPINDEYNYRTPIFIDKYDNFCAVGYLIKSSGHETISRMIAAKTNLAYVHDMKYKEVYAWANEHGFTEDELAWIQPGYPPVRHCASIGKGTDGELFELYTNYANDKLYVGGNFTKVDSSITANNIAYITETNGNYTWHNMGSGVNGPVYAIMEHDNKIFVGGNFTQAGGVVVNNIAYWDGAQWHDAGVSGKINDLVVYNNKLYAVGQFDILGGLIDVNFATWDDTAWTPYPGLMGHINTMEVVNNELLLGGQFNYGTIAKNAVKWTVANGFELFANNIENEVNDFENFGDTVYAVCSRISAIDSSLILKLKNNTWTPDWTYLMNNPFPPAQDLTFKTLCAHADTLMTGGDFDLYPLVGNYAQNCFTLINPIGSPNWINLDSVVNKMIVFKNELIIAGKFKYGNAGFGWGTTALNSIARKTYNAPTAVGVLSKNEPEIIIYPNPTPSSSIITVQNTDAEKLSILDINGRTLATYSIKEKKANILLPQLSSGNYIVETWTRNGQKSTQKLIIK